LILDSGNGVLFSDSGCGGVTAGCPEGAALAEADRLHSRRS